MQSACQDILHELFLSETFLPGVDAVLDKVVIKTCEDLLDDIPSGDPRWVENDRQIGLGSSYSMQILHQLQDKQKAQSLFYNFLRGTELWNRLSAYTLRDTPMATVYVLGLLVLFGHF